MNGKSKSVRLTFLLLLVFVVSWQATAQDADVAAGQSRFSEHHWVEYIIGDLPVIISAPHGGRLIPESIPNRTKGTLLSDTNTDLLAKDITQAFYRRTGGYPHVVICHVKRIKVDCNRNIEEGAQGNPTAEQVWHAFNDFIKEAQHKVIQTGSQGLYVDLHGHAHAEARLELGYLLTNKQLQQNDQDLCSLQHRTSIHNILLHNKVPFLELLRGESSFGGLMQQRGYPAVPSPAYPHAGDGKFFSGGENTRRYTGQDNDLISGFQMECPRKGIRDTTVNRRAFADAFVDAATKYLQIHCDLEIDSKKQIKE